MVWPVMFNPEGPVLVTVSGRVLVGCGRPGTNFRLPKTRLEGMSFTVPAVRVIVALACLVLSATDAAVIVTAELLGTVAGAAYTVAVPLAVMAWLMVPHAPEHVVVPCDRVQLTPLLVGSLLTVGVNGVAFSAAVAPMGIVALAGETETVMAGTTSGIEPCWAGSESEVATMVTFRSLAGGAEGAV